MEQLKEIAVAAGQGAVKGFTDAISGEERDTKGEDRRNEETKNALRWPIIAGFGVLAVLILILALKRR